MSTRNVRKPLTWDETCQLYLAFLAMHRGLADLEGKPNRAVSRPRGTRRAIASELSPRPRQGQGPLGQPAEIRSPRRIHPNPSGKQIRSHSSAIRKLTGAGQCHTTRRCSNRLAGARRRSGGLFSCLLCLAPGASPAHWPAPALATRRVRRATRCKDCHTVPTVERRASLPLRHADRVFHLEDPGQARLQAYRGPQG